VGDAEEHYLGKASLVHYLIIACHVWPHPVFAK